MSTRLHIHSRPWLGLALTLPLLALGGCGDSAAEGDGAAGTAGLTGGSAGDSGGDGGGGDW